ncbi:MAG: hypothetical protein ACK465_07910, partial [Flavobacteriia bacterium]
GVAGELAVDADGGLHLVGGADVAVEAADGLLRFELAERTEGGDGGEEVRILDDVVHLVGAVETEGLQGEVFAEAVVEDAGADAKDGLGGLVGAAVDAPGEADAGSQVVVVGDVSGNLIYNNPITTVTNAFGQRIFVLKTNANGTLLWATAFGSNSGLTARSVSVASDQKVYVTGSFNCAFDQMQTLPNMHEGFWNSLGYRDVYVLCLQANGNLAWSNRGFGKKDDLGLGIANFNAQEPVVVGFQSAYQHFSTILPPTPLPSSQDPNALQLNSSFSTYDLPASAKSGFVAKVLQANTDTFSYFILPDTLVGFIEPDLDTVSFCANQVGLLEFEPQTGPYNDPLAPFYTVSWSDGTIQDAILPSATGWYSA